MKVNESTSDRIVRVVVGLALLAVVVFGSVGTVLGWVLGLLGALLVVTGAVGFCPAYAALRFSTRRTGASTPSRGTARPSGRPLVR